MQRELDEGKRPETARPLAAAADGALDVVDENKLPNGGDVPDPGASAQGSPDFAAVLDVVAHGLVAKQALAAGRPWEQSITYVGQPGAVDDDHSTKVFRLLHGGAFGV